VKLSKKFPVLDRIDGVSIISKAIVAADSATRHIDVISARLAKVLQVYLVQVQRVITFPYLDWNGLDLSDLHPRSPFCLKESFALLDGILGSVCSSEGCPHLESVDEKQSKGEKYCEYFKSYLPSWRWGALVLGLTGTWGIGYGWWRLRHNQSICLSTIMFFASCVVFMAGMCGVLWWCLTL